MPTMPRVNAKTTKIAFKIIGVPQNMKTKPSKLMRKIDKRLIFEETIRVR